mmetsp:Transcript_144/g.523  ORF Transcript_144/g.523 Transcript_144/m.523 type:complete len:89 (-) Transcript_144:223-489(-)
MPSLQTPPSREQPPPRNEKQTAPPPLVPPREQKKVKFFFRQGTLAADEPQKTGLNEQPHLLATCSWECSARAWAQHHFHHPRVAIMGP